MITATTSSPRTAEPAEPATNAASRILLGWWAIYLLLSPFYLLRSGNPQPADVFLVATLPFGLLLLPHRLPSADVMLPGLAFVAYVWLVNLFWWMIYYDPLFLRSSSFYLYNIIVFLVTAITMQYYREQFTKLLLAVILILVAVQLAVIIFDIRFFRIREIPRLEGWRAIGTFNNPNQLGYWSLLIASCLVAIGRGRRLSVVDMTALLFLGYMTSLSLSRAAMGSMLAVVIIGIAWRGLTMKSMILICIGAIVAMGIAGYGMQPGRMFKESEVYINVEKRWQKKEDGSETRGYDRIFNHPQYLMFGAGEGLHTRFHDDGDNTEFHSSWGVLFFHYGAVGSALFLAFVVAAFRGAPWGQILLLVPIGLYGLTHQGLRFTLFWIFLGLVVGMRSRGRQDNVGSAQQRPPPG